MLKLAKYIKPFIGLILAAIVFLFIQAMADLSLPDYMSKIVNTGIQQGGIENAVPMAIRKSQLEKIITLLNDEEKEQVIGSYTLIDNSSNEYENYKNDYPILEDEAIYVLNEIDDVTLDDLNTIMARGLMLVAGFENIQAQINEGNYEFNGQIIPANSDIFEILSMLPEEQKNLISETINKQMGAIDESTMVQMATQSVKGEYELLGVDVDKIQSDYIKHTGFIMLLISLVSAIAIVLVGFFASRTAAGLARNLRQSIFRKVEGFSKAELDRFSTSSLITRTTNDITQIQNLMVIMIRMIFYAPIMGVGGIIRALGKSSSMSWIIAIAVAALLILVGSVFYVALPKFKAVQKLLDRLNLVTRENLSGMMVVRAFNTQKFEEERFDVANSNLTKTNLFVNRVMVVMFPSMMLIMNVITLLIVWVGAHQIAQSQMLVGDMMAFMQYAMQIIFAFLMMSFMFIMIPRASVAANRIAEVLEIEPEIVEPENPKEFIKSKKGIVEFKNVSFRYSEAEEDMLKNISFTAYPGETTAFIGSTGSGKTTLVNLIPRFYDVTKGQVLVNGVDVREVSQKKLRDEIGYVPQKSSLFSGTIKSNLLYANETASVDEINKAIEVAQANVIVENKEKGINSEISQGGSNMSGGQKQRLSIARAIMKKPQIYIFDDSFSALDFKTDKELRKALNKETKNSTVLIVAQRISTIMNAEKIIVLDEGKIVGIGTHKELLENNKTYQEIAYSQLSKEELA